MQRPPGSSLGQGGRQGRGGGQGRSRGLGWNRGQGWGGGQGRGGGQREGGCQGQGRGQSHGEGQGQGKGQGWGLGKGQGECQDQAGAVGFRVIQGVGRSQGGRLQQNIGQMYQLSGQIPSLLSPILCQQASFQQNTLQSASQISCPTVGHGHPMAPRQALIQARSQVPPATSMQQRAITKHQNQNTSTHTGGTGCLPASNGAVGGIRPPGHANAQMVGKLKQGHNNNSQTMSWGKSGAEKKAEEGQHVGVAQCGRRGVGMAGRGRQQNVGGAGESNTIQSLLTVPTGGMNQQAQTCVSFGQLATQVSQTVRANKKGVRKEGEEIATVRRNRRVRTRYRVRRHGIGRGTVPLTSVAEIASTIANGLAAPVLSNLEKVMKNLLLKENEVGNPITAKDGSKDYKGDFVEISGKACTSSRMNVTKEIDSRSFQRPLCDDQARVYYETLQRDSLSQSGSCVWEEKDRDNEGLFKSEEIIPGSIGLSCIRQTRSVGHRGFRLRGALRGVRGGFRRRGVPQPSGQSWAAAPLRSDEVMIEVFDDPDARSQTSECSESQVAGSEVGSWIDVEDTDEVRFGDANPYQQTTEVQQRSCGKRRSRRHGRGFGKGQAVHCQTYFPSQEVNPDVETLCGTKAVLGNNQNTLGDRSQQRRTAQSVELTEERKVTDETKQQKEGNQNVGQSNRIKSAGDKRPQKKTNNIMAVKEDFTNSNSQPAFEVDQNLVIDYLVNHHKGSCTLFDVQNNSGIFPCILQPEEVLHSLGFCRFIRVLIDPSDLDNSIVKVYMKKLRLCVGSKPPKGCSQNNCQYIHLCRDFIMDCCFLRKCTLCHDVESEHNMKILSECGIEIFSAEQKLSLIRCSNLLVCSEHNNSEGCPVPNSCFKIHVCNSYILNKCLLPPDRCPHGHDLFSERNRKILRLCEVDQLKVNFLLRMVVGFHGEPFNKGSSSGMREQQKAFAGRTKPEEDNSSYFEREQVSGWVATQQKVMDMSFSPDKSAECYKSEKHSLTSNSVQKQCLPTFCGTVTDTFIPVSSGCKETQREELSLKEQQKNECKSFEEHICNNQMESCTERHGSQSPYLWRVRVLDDWFVLENNELIEEEFSNPAAEKFWGTMLDMTVCIDFSSMMSEVGAIQRLSTPSYAFCRDKIDATRWLWYWLDSTGKWVLCGQNNKPLYQDVLEAKFLNDSKHVCCFEINGCRYELDFAKMEHRNLKTNFSHLIRRRPFYRNQEAMEMPSIEYHYDESKIPFGWAPMDTESKHGMELVPLHLDDANYESIKCSFFATLRATNFEIQRIYRLQNLDLWQSFQMKKVLMEKKTGSEVEEVNVYHGTPEEETIRWICSLGFDQRMHGRHGANYGTGVYFATTAKYSHCYTRPSERGLRYMFCARVLVGRSVEGKCEYRRPPPIDPRKPTEGLYDTCVDSIAKPSIYVVFDNNQSYPEFLIEYRDVEAVSEADDYQLHPTPASTNLGESQYTREGFYDVVDATSAAYSPYSATLYDPAYTSDFSSPCDTTLPNRFCGPPSSFMSPPSGNYPPSASSSGSDTWSSAGHYDYFNAIPATTYPLQADVSASAASNQPHLNMYPLDNPPSDAPSYSHEKPKNCYIM